MMNRREWLGVTLGASGALALRPELLRAIQQGQLIKRAIPSTGEMLPIVGLGTSATFSSVAGNEDFAAVRDVMKTMIENGATVFDTAPSYGASEQVGGAIAKELGITDRLFWATKVNVAQGGRRGGGSSSADPARARAQIDTSFSRIQKDKIDLIQVHNLGDMPTQLGILKELKAAGRIRYVGATSTNDAQYPQLMEFMRNEPLDFVGIGYAIDDRALEADLLPLAIQRKIGVLVYQPFGRRRLWNRVEGRELPAWANDIDAKTWAQFFIKYVAAHPAVTCVTPATSQGRHMLDNIAGGIGRLPDEAMRKRMAEFVDALPPAPSGRGRGGF